MASEFTFIPTPFSAPAPGQYLLSRGDRRDKIVVCCPRCEGEYQLPKHYIVGLGGIVNPAIRCPLYGCGWEKMAKFSEWKAR
jgi:hypothetical protein